MTGPPFSRERILDDMGDDVLATVFPARRPRRPSEDPLAPARGCLLAVAVALGAILGVALCFGLLAVFASQAHAKAPKQAHIDRASAVAHAVWGPRAVEVRVAPRPPKGDIGPAAGWAVWNSGVVYLSSRFDWMGYPQVCDTLLHEWGHAVGWQHPLVRDDPLTPEREGAHSDNPRSVMYPIGTGDLGIGPGGRRRWYGIDRRCLRSDRALDSRRRNR